MLYQINHITTYSYDQLVLLEPHLLRLQPHSNAWQKLRDFQLEVIPQPQGISEFTDFQGNNYLKVWFREPTSLLKVTVPSQVETFKSNPFDYLLEPWALQLPFDYPNNLKSLLIPYLSFEQGFPDPDAVELAQNLCLEVEANPVQFLFKLNEVIYQNCQYLTRETGYPWPAGITWRSKQGSCRDLTVLWMEVCRAIGLGTRFVSGYQEGDPDQEAWDLHAWAEVYLPGAGWRGYDPTLGLAVSDRHVTIAVSNRAIDTAPILGKFTPLERRQATQSWPQSAIASQIDLKVLN